MLTGTMGRSCAQCTRLLCPLSGYSNAVLNSHSSIVYGTLKNDRWRETQVVSATANRLMLKIANFFMKVVRLKVKSNLIFSKSMFPTVSQLDSFTDVFGETIDRVADENFSPPLSFPTTCDTLPENNGVNTIGVETIRPAKHTGQHGEFRSVEEIDPKYRCLFTYPYFNLVQSRIIEDALYSDKSLVVCAPTGSGKTVVFELAILQLLMHMEDTHNNGDFKIIYMAPVKAVCNERLTEWYPKLTKLGLLCIEVTGDTEVDFSQLSPYRVIITTPEKWDILTRRWRDHRGLVEMIKLFLIDEVHILNDETRGPVLEAVVSRMKTVESAAQSAYRIEQLQQQYQGAEPTCNSPPSIRFVAVSATVSNPEDVADWLGTNKKPAVFHKFGDECRPVKLRRIVEGYACAEGTSIFKFDLILNYKLWPIIQKYYDGKPTLIFCNTRKSVALTAEALSREVTVSFSPEQKAKLTALASTIKNKKLQMLVMSGVGCHHAGLLYEERINIERAFRNRDLPILITTTTLAMGVNLPAHLVIVKNTQQYVNGAYQEYSISTVLQMVGRAGRPQFDTDATAVIMTRLQDKPRYQALVGGSEPLQSYLHKRLAENLNSEAALGTVTDVAQCVEWLRSTFLFVRAAKDPKRYLGLPPAAPQQLILKKIEELCVKAMNSLASSGLITMDDASCIESTEAGRLMSLFYMDVETMKNFMKINGSETLERLLWIVCESHELADMHLRVDERRCLNLLNRNNKAATIRFPMKGKISTRQMKLNCIIQATLGCLPIPDPALNQEAIKVMRTASRVCKCLVKYITRPELPPQPQTFSAVLSSIILSKCIEAHLWENSPFVSKQLKGIGPTFSTLLASAGVTSFMMLEESHPRDLERIMNKGPPAGNIIRNQVSFLPKYQLSVTPIDARSVTIQLILLNHNHLSENMGQLTAGDTHKSYLVVGDSENYLLLLTQFTDKDFISVFDGTMTYEVTRKLQSEHKILIHCVSSVIVGIDVQADYLFLDLEPQAPREFNHALWSSSNTPRQDIGLKQTAIRDVYKERKRKNDSDITQCKEKKKREYTLTQKFKALKESFSKTSKTLKTDIDKSVEMSNKVIHDLMDSRNMPQFPETNQVIFEAADEFPTVDLAKYVIDGSNNRPGFPETSQVIEYPTVDLTKDVVADKLEEITINDNDDYIDDIQIDSLLSKIESEISAKDHISINMQYNNVPDTNIPTRQNVHSNARPMPEAKKMQLKYWNKNDTQYLANQSSRSVNDLNKPKKLKSNFNIVDLIEKKANIADESVEKEVDKSIGFSEAIKSQINKFLQQAQNTTKPKMPVIDELLSVNEKSMVEELPEIFVDGYIQDDTNTTCRKSSNKVQCDEIKTQAKVISKDVDKYKQSYINDENFNENLDLPEVNLNTAQIVDSNQYEQKHDQTFYSKIEEFDNINRSANLQDNNKTNDSNDFNAIYPIMQLNTNFKYNPTTNQNLALSSNITIDNSIPVNPLQNTRMNESKEEHCNWEKVNKNPLATLELNQYAENQAHTSIGLNESDQQIIIYNKMAKLEIKTIEGRKSCDRSRAVKLNQITLNHDSPLKVAVERCEFTLNKYIPTQTLETTPNESSDVGLTEVSDKILATFQPIGVNNYGKKIINGNLMDMDNTQKSTTPARRIDYGQAPQLISTSNAFTHSNESLKQTAHISNVNLLETITKPSYTNNAIILYNDNVETNGKIHRQRPAKLKSSISYSDYQNTFDQDINDLLVENMMNQNHHQNGPSDHCPNSSNLVLTNQMRAGDPNNDLADRCHLKPLRITENSMRNINRSFGFYNASSKGNMNSCLSDTKQVKQEKHENFNNQNETYFKRYSYTATKVDVCTKKYAPDHELRITRKLKLDVDVTEILKPDNTNQTNEAYNGDIYKEHGVMKPKQNTENIRENIFLGNMTNKNEGTNDDDVIVIKKPGQNENSIARKSMQGIIDDKPKYSATNNSIGNILQKYSKILLKSESSKPLINKTYKNSDTNSAKTMDHIELKSRKPFKMSDINGVKIPLSLELKNTNRSVVSSQIELDAAPKTIKDETKEKIELYKQEDINLTPKTNYNNITVDYNKSYESPVFADSLKIDSVEDIKDENIFNPKRDMKDESMFNPKLLLQYCIESNEDNDIIAPPAGFGDNPTAYSPIASQEITEFYNIDDNIKKMEDNLNSADFESDLQSPKEMETWCLSKDDETYESPMRSSPWVISQRAHTNLGARRDKLCQFKFVRKKMYTP